jgi:CheY-like chemotaxis protein
VDQQSEKGQRVLVVDDEPEFAELVAQLLLAAGYEVAVAFDGEAALAQVRACAPDLITLDIRMPRKSGLLFYRQIKSREAYRHIPVIVITGLIRDDRDWENFIRSFLEVDHLPRPQAYMDKPFEEEELLEVVEKVLNEAQPALPRL